MKDPQNFLSKYDKYFVSNVDYEKGGLKYRFGIALKLLYSFEAKKKFERLIKNERPDLVHLNNIYHQLSPSILHIVQKYNLPSVMSLRDYKIVCASYSMFANRKVCEACKDKQYYNCFLKMCVKGSRTKSLLNTIEMYLHHKILNIYDIVDIYISPSKFLRAKLVEMGFTGKIVYLPNFVKIEEYKPDFNWSENSIIYFGRLSIEKGLFTLMEAVAGLNIKLKIIGKGPLKDRIKEKMQEEKINNVELLGYLSGNDLKDEIRKAKFVILPSEWYENNPRTIIEGFALGKPAIGSRIGGIPELVKDNDTGLTFSSGDVTELRSKIMQLIKHPDMIQRMGRNARNLVEKELNDEVHYNKLIKIYKMALGRNQNSKQVAERPDV